MSSRIDEPAGEPRTVDEARDAVERSRQRISSTLDALEERIVEKKHELQEKVDVLRPVRDQIVNRPFTAIAVGVGIGALLGSIGGGRDDEEHEHRRSGRIRGVLEDRDRKELRKWRRARRERLRARSRHDHDDHDDHDRDDDSGSGLRFDALRHQLMGAVTSAVTAAVTRKVRQYAMNAIGGNGGSAQRGDRNDRGDRLDRY
jgi:ElaB/YqjD/DUF883 family membrane-anchored ribosome-binding protein